MEKQKMMVAVTAVAAVFIITFLIQPIQATESPEYKKIVTESEFEIRYYKESVWMSAQTKHRSFHQATKFGFHRLFQYIQGANLNSSRIPMTKPVLTSIVPGAGPLNSSAYSISFYVPLNFQGDPPLPLPELNLKPVSYPGHCVAVRTFSGFARDGNVVKEAEKLADSLSSSPWAKSISTDNKYVYSIAQYDSPFKLVKRVNEVWVDVDGSESDGCGSQKTAKYDEHVLTDLISLF